MYLDMHCNADTINNPTITYCETGENEGLVSIKKIHCNAVALRVSRITK